MLSDRYANHRVSLITGLFALLGCQVMFMLAPTYGVMILARMFQGMSSSVVWTSGLSLL